MLKTPLGNALLVGVGGSGRKSLATLATFVAEPGPVTTKAPGGRASALRYDQFSIEITKNYSVTDWHDEVPSQVLGRAGEREGGEGGKKNERERERELERERERERETEGEREIARERERIERERERERDSDREREREGKRTRG